MGPFFYINQYVHAKSIITVPLDVFNKMMEERAALVDSKQLILLSNTGRCGSTLLTQLFEDMVPGTVAISEPEVRQRSRELNCQRVVSSNSFNERGRTTKGCEARPKNL